MKLYDYQQVGVDWLVPRRRAYLADAPGLGKTPQLVRAARAVGAEQPLVVCPAIARPLWARQWARWDGRAVAPVVWSYDELIRRDSTPDHDLLILDEAQACRNTGAQRTRRALKLANQAKRVWLASGTPLPNGNPAELYPVLRAVWPDELRRLRIVDYMGYLRFFTTFVPTQYGIKIVGQKNVPVMTELLGRIMLRRTESEEIDLPALRVDEFFLPAQSMPQEVEEAGEEARGWGDDIPANAHLATARRLLGIEKALVVGDLIADELADGAYQQIVVGTYHLEVAEYLTRLLGGVCLTGQTSKGERERRIALFQAGKVRVLVAQIQTAGTAIDLWAAHEVALVEQSWAPDDNWQLIKRIHRIGQSVSCRARLFYAETPLDRAVARVLARKARLRGEVIRE